MARQDIEKLDPGKVALTNSSAWGFDVWYESAPIVVSYIAPKKSIIVGLCPKTGGTLGDVSGFDILGPEGLKDVFLGLDEEIAPGFGGRETIGGSPRNVEMSHDDAERAYEVIKELINDHSLYNEAVV